MYKENDRLRRTKTDRKRLLPGSDYTNSGRLSHDLIVAGKFPAFGPIFKIGNDERMCNVG